MIIDLNQTGKRRIHGKTKNPCSDMHTLDGLYAKPEHAFEAGGEKGLIVEFVIDVPEKKMIKVID